MEFFQQGPSYLLRKRDNGGVDLLKHGLILFFSSRALDNQIDFARAGHVTFYKGFFPQSVVRPLCVVCKTIVYFSQ